jgi:RNA polymerase sigma-70 factor (ECF subfamily)
MVAEDITQESFISAYGSLADFREDVPFGIWLRRIVINRSLDHLRKRKWPFEELKEDTIQTEEQIYGGEEPEKDNTKLIAAVKQAMNELPDGYRVILSLSLFEGYDHEEISQILTISQSTSRSQLTRAKRKLKEKLEEKFRTHD